MCRGLIGPTRQFGAGSLYHPELYALVFGALIPLPFWLWQRKYPQSRVKLISMPIVLNGVSQIPPATGINYSSWFLVAFAFQYVVRRTRFAWWSKFNYVLSSALDSGTVVAIMVIFFALQFPKGITQPEWWGNTVYLNSTSSLHLSVPKPDWCRQRWITQAQCCELAKYQSASAKLACSLRPHHLRHFPLWFWSRIVHLPLWRHPSHLCINSISASHSLSFCDLSPSGCHVRPQVLTSPSSRRAT